MKIYVYPADEAGCGYYRMIWPAEELQRQGYDITIVRPKQRSAMFQGVMGNDGHLIDVRIPEDADIVVLQRITHRHLVRGIELIRQKGVTVVIDIDDDLSAINPSNPAFMAMHPIHGTKRDHTWGNAQLACEAASFVIVSTDALLPRYAPHGRGAVIRNCIPARYLQVPRHDSAVIGWGGSLHSHPDDLHTVGVGVAQAVGDSLFHQVGPVEGVRAALRLPYEPTYTGPLDIISQWPEGVAALGIGIAPLADTRFNAGKSWLKPLEYSALGVPWVASPRAEYIRLHKMYNIGALAAKPKQWARELRALVNNVELRREMSQRGREVAAQLTIEGNAWRWLEAWNEAYKIEH